MQFYVFVTKSINICILLVANKYQCHFHTSDYLLTDLNNISIIEFDIQ